MSGRPIGQDEVPLPLTRAAVQERLDELLRMAGEDAGELLLVRHAEAAAGEGHDPMLSCLGLVQAECLAARLSTLWFEAVYSAPERRAQQTARVLAAGVHREVQVMEGLADVGFAPARGVALPGPEEYARRFDEVPRWDSLPGFECSTGFRRRAVLALECVLASNTAKRVVVVTHASVINAYLSMLLGVPADQFFTAEHASVSVVRWRDGRYALRSLNDVSHLSPAGPFEAEAGVLRRVHGR